MKARAPTALLFRVYYGRRPRWKIIHAVSGPHGYLG